MVGTAILSHLRQFAIRLNWPYVDYAPLTSAKSRDPAFLMHVSLDDARHIANWCRKSNLNAPHGQSLTTETFKCRGMRAPGELTSYMSETHVRKPDVYGELLGIN